MEGENLRSLGFRLKAKIQSPMGESKKPTMASPTTVMSDDRCCNCSLPGVEIRVTPCQCSFHTKCFPVAHLADNSQQKVRRGGELQCPSCGSKEMKGIYIMPIDVQEHYYGKALRTQSSTSPGSSAKSKTMTPAMDELYLALAPIFFFETGQSNHTNIAIAEEVEIRNGRWTPEEIRFIECLINSFKEGGLPISTGVTLNNFLRSIFLCKSTRLRKKIKNANFCTSTFLLRTNENQQLCAKELSKLQEGFLSSLDDRKSKKLLQLSMRRMWATYFFNLCMHLGYESIIAQDWLDSLEEVEERVNSARESKKIRERRNRMAENRSSSYSSRQYNPNPGLDGSNHRYHLNLNRSNHSHQMNLDRSNHSYHRPLTLNVSNHSHRPLNLDSSNHSYHSHLSHRKSNLSLALDRNEQGPRVGSLKRPIPIASAQGLGLDSSNHSHGFIGLGLNSYPSRPMISPLPPRHGSLPTDFSTAHKHSSSPPKHTNSSTNKSDSASSFWGKGMPRQPEIVPLEITEHVEDTGNLSDVSDSESNTHTTSMGFDNDPLCSLLQDTNRSMKRIRVDTSPKKKPDPFLEDVIEEVSTDDLCDVSDICDQFGDWSPFVRKVSNFVENEDLPFDYFDVWVVSNNNEQGENDMDDTHDLTKGSRSDVVLRNVGHSARSDGGSIWTLYHMNEFAKLSTNFRFPPGIGLPGRVLSSGQPLWDDSIPDLSQMKFPRVEGARMHGIKKALGIPVHHTTFGKVIVAMYSTKDIVKDLTLVQKCYSRLQGAQGIDQTLTKTHLLLDEICEDGSAKETPALPTSDSGGDCAEPDEQLIVNLLAKYAPLIGVNSDPFAAHHTSLRLLLLRPQSTRTESQNEFISIMRKSYRNYMESNRAEDDVATLLVHEWKFLNDMQPQAPPS